MEESSQVTDWIPIMATFRTVISIPFQNYQFVERCMYKFMHIVTLACSIKQSAPAVIRVGCHSLLATILHTILAETSTRRGDAITASENLSCDCFSSLQNIVVELSEDSPFLSATIQASSFDELVTNINSVIQFASQIQPGLQSHRAKWLELAFQVCYMESQSSLVTSRCFVVCGALLREEDRVTSSIYIVILPALKTNLWEGNSGNISVHLMRCLNRLVPFITPKQRMDLFWIVILLIQLADGEDVFHSTLHLLVVVLEAISTDKSQHPNGQGSAAISSGNSLLETLERSRGAENRNEDIEACLQSVERQYIGLSFSTQEDIAFSICASVLKGIQLPACVSLLHRLSALFSSDTAPLGCLPLFMLAATTTASASISCTEEEVEAEDDGLVPSFLDRMKCVLFGVQIQADQSNYADMTLGSPGFHTAPSSPNFQSPSPPMGDDANDVGGSTLNLPTPSREETLCSQDNTVPSPLPTMKKQLFPATPTKLEGSSLAPPREPPIQTAMAIMGTPGTKREGQSRDAIEVSDRRAIVFTALLCAAIKSSQNIKFLRCVYALLLEAANLPSVVKYMYRFFPPFTKACHTLSNSLSL